MNSDINAIRKALKLGKEYATQALQSHDLKYNRHPATESERKEIVDDVVIFNHALSAISRLESGNGIYSIEPHGDGWALYRGRDGEHHGFNLCRLFDFDANGEATRSAIVQALNRRLESGEGREIICHEIEALAVDPANDYAEGYNDALPDCIRIVRQVLAAPAPHCPECPDPQSLKPPSGMMSGGIMQCAAPQGDEMTDEEIEECERASHDGGSGRYISGISKPISAPQKE